MTNGIAEIFTSAANVATTEIFTGTTGAVESMGKIVGAGILGRGLRKRDERINDAIRKYNAIRATFEVHPEECEELLVDSEDYQPVQQNAPQQAPLDQAVDKITGVLNDHIQWARATSQSRQLVHESRINRTTQASWFALIGVGGSQITHVALSALQVTGSLLTLVCGLSIVSSVFTLFAASYGFVMTANELAENREKQRKIDQELALLSGQTFEKDALMHTLRKLQTEEALLVQQRNSSAVSFVTALLSIVATALSITGMSGILSGYLYYALLGSTLLLSVSTFAYQHRSMTEKRYIQRLYGFFMTFPDYFYQDNAPTKQIMKNMHNLTRCLMHLVNRELIKDETGEIRQELHRLFGNLFQELHEQDLLSEQARNVDAIRTLDEREDRIASLSKLFRKLVEFQMTLMAEEIVCRLGIAGMEITDLKPVPPSTPEEEVLMGMRQDLLLGLLSQTLVHATSS